MLCRPCIAWAISYNTFNGDSVQRSAGCRCQASAKASDRDHFRFLTLFATSPSDQMLSPRGRLNGCRQYSEAQALHTERDRTCVDGRPISFLLICALQLSGITRMPGRRGAVKSGFFRCIKPWAKARFCSLLQLMALWCSDFEHRSGRIHTCINLLHLDSWRARCSTY